MWVVSGRGGQRQNSHSVSRRVDWKTMLAQMVACGFFVEAWRVAVPESAPGILQIGGLIFWLLFFGVIALVRYVARRSLLSLRRHK